MMGNNVRIEVWGMGENKIFEMRAINDADKREFVKESVDDYRKYVDNVIFQLESVEDRAVRLLCYFSLIESIAQDVANYPDKQQQKTFVDFVLKYQSLYSYLEAVDPVTLFYHSEKEISDKVNLNDFIDGNVYEPQEKFIRDKADSIKGVLCDSFGAQNADKMVGKHRYVDLLYRLRCRVSHEFSHSHVSINTFHKEPYYMNCNRTYVSKGKIVQDDVWQLHIPMQFVKNLCVNCINNYLDECIKDNVLPTANDSMDRRCELSWYSY